MDARRALGDAGESLAEAFLRSKGYAILARKYRTRGGEIDLIARDGDEVVFVEVKARGRSTFGYPEEAVDGAKMKKLVRTAEYYLQTLDVDVPCRFDVIAIEHVTNPPEIEHFKDVDIRL